MKELFSTHVTQKVDATASRPKKRLIANHSPRPITTQVNPCTEKEARS